MLTQTSSTIVNLTGAFEGCDEAVLAVDCYHSSYQESAAGFFQTYENLSPAEVFHKIMEWPVLPAPWADTLRVHIKDGEVLLKKLRNSKSAFEFEADLEKQVPKVAAVVEAQLLVLEHFRKKKEVATEILTVNQPKVILPFMDTASSEGIASF
jgi:hypothetical protein